MNAPKRVLVVRDDKLGDVLLSLPALKYLRDSAPELEIDFACREVVGAIIQPTLERWRVGLVVSGTPSMRGYDTVIFLHGTLSLAISALLSGVKIRVGQYTKPWSFLFYNVGVRQRRSLAERNEAEYTLELIQCFLKKVKLPDSNSLPGLTLESSPLEVDESRKVLEALEVRGSFAVVHPGMGGSALNVSNKVYLDIVKSLREKGLEVLLSQGPEDEQVVSDLMAMIPGVKVIRKVSLAVLREIFRKAKLVVAPSTGPLHLAHLSGTDVVGLYPPVPSQHPRRWSPWGGKGKVTVLCPEVDCPASSICILDKCQIYNCMETHPWGARFREICL